MSGRIVAGVILLAAAAAFAIGYGVGSSRAPEPRPYRSTVAPDEIALDGVAADAREILLEPDTLRRIAELSQLLRTLPPEALDELLAAYETVFLDRGDIDLVLLATWWARFDPEGAYRWTQREWSADHPLAVGAVFHTWALRDPHAAVAAAADVPNPQLRTGYTHQAIAGWEESGQPGVLEFVRSLPETADRQRAIAVLARRRVLRDGVEASFEWADQLDDDQGWFKLNAIQRVASAAAEVDPKAAAAFAERHYQGPFGHALIDRVGRIWVKRDPAAAMQWLSTLEPGKTRDKGVRESFLRWVRDDPEAAGAWLQRTERGAWLDPAMAIYARRLAKSEPRQALEWADGIFDAVLRQSTIARIARVWGASDEAAARAWVEQSDLPQWLKDKLMGPASPSEAPASEGEQAS